MTQNANDVEIANQGFAAFRQDLNDVLEDITTLHSGDDAPSTTYANQFWYETDTDKLYIRNEDNDAWIELFTLDQVNDKLTQIGSGDISIAGDLTVDTNTLHVDSTSNRVGVGTAVANGKLHVKDATDIAMSNDADGQLVIEGNGYSGAIALNATGMQIYQNSSARNIIFGNNETEQLRIDASGNVGIGNSSPEGASGYSMLTVGSSTATTGVINAYDGTVKASVWTTDSGVARFGSRTDHPITLEVNGSEKMRIDGSGNVLIGNKTGLSDSGAGHAFAGSAAHGLFYHTRSGGIVGSIKRETSDGDILRFIGPSAHAGFISTIASTMYLRTGEVGLRFGASNDVRPCFSTGLNRDNAIDLGTSSARFDDIYATNGTIQTSDQNEKQQIASLTAAEVTAAKAISKLFKTFKWNDSVTENGDNARTHTGVIAQDVQQALMDAGLDAGDYAFFISNTWWETSTDVAAVAAVAEVLDDDGNVVTEAVEAVDAYTRVETYDTQADAPAGATERTRLGIRYPELLAFVGAATEQRLADIETRLTALETV